MTNLREGEAWLTQRATELVEQAIYVRPEDGRRMHLLSPVDRGHYQAMFLRDYVYKILAMPQLFADETTPPTLDLFFEHMSADYAPPEYIHRDGRIEYWCYGPGPLTDTAASLALGVLAYCREVDDYDYLALRAGVLIGALKATPRHPVSGLIWIDPAAPHSPYGYTDSVQKTGEELFSSVLLFDACRQMASGLEKIRMGVEAREMRAMAVQIQNGVEGLYDPGSGLYLAASYHCRQPDVWGSALAVSTRIAGRRSDDVSAALAGLYERIVWKGQVRHLPEPMLWERRLSQAREYRRDFNDGKFYARGQSTYFLADQDEPNRYQNGAYWATPVSWLVGALARTNRELAEKTLSDTVAFFREDGIWECVYPSGYRQEKDYTVSAVMPLIGFRTLRTPGP